MTGIFVCLWHEFKEKVSSQECDEPFVTQEGVPNRSPLAGWASKTKRLVLCRIQEDEACQSSTQLGISRVQWFGNSGSMVRSTFYVEFAFNWGCLAARPVNQHKTHNNSTGLAVDNLWLSQGRL
jgi:hypothetical protein